MAFILASHPAMAGKVPTGTPAPKNDLPVQKVTATPSASKASDKKAVVEDDEYGAGEHSLGIGFGQVMLFGSKFGDTASNDLGYNFIYEYKVSDMFSVLADYGYSRHLNDDRQNELIFKTFSPNFKLNFGYYDRLTIFGLAGFGLYHVNRTTGPYAGSVNSFGFNAGPGIDLRLNRHFKFGSMITFHNVFDKNDAEAKNPSGKGMEIGGTYLRMFITASYVF